MKRNLSFAAFGNATSLFLTLICVPLYNAFCREAWQPWFEAFRARGASC